MQFLGILLFYGGSVLVPIAVHEFGHYMAGLVGGIPRRDMRVRLLAFPQHVVLRDGARWVSPAQIDRYVELTWQYLKTRPRVYLYVAGGILLETAFSTAAGYSLLLSGRPKLALAFVGMTLFLLLPWIVVDAVSVARGRVNGDLSGLWQLARVPTALLLAAALVPRGLILWEAAG